MPEPIISIAIVDDHTLFRSGLVSLLEEFEELNIVFEATNGIDLQAKLAQSNPVQLILMDINMPQMDGYQATKWVKDNYPGIFILALSMFEEEQAIIGMLRAGAVGYMLKESNPSDVLTAIKAIVSKGFYMNEMVSGRLLIAVKDGDSKPIFTPRELTFLQHCSTEMTYKEIADLMSVSPRTVDNYRESLFSKLNIKSRTGLVVYAIRNNIISI
ncbi:response regulator [Pedobacter sp. MW01-1-1]|uniref:response regulator n=1 Tax=Pedobacter sp. MW01-1-1 TaxID=3383027 RepID=UPI003FEDC018